MKKTNLLSFSGITMLLSGLTILLSSEIGIQTAKIITPILFILSGIFSVLFASANKEFLVPKNFHTLQGLGMISFAIALIIIADSLESFLMVTTFFTMVYGLLEIIFAFMVLNSKKIIDSKIMIIRIISGVLNLLGGFALFMTALGKTPETGILIAGFLVLFGGLSFTIFAKKIKA